MTAVYWQGDMWHDAFRCAMTHSDVCHDSIIGAMTPCLICTRAYEALVLIAVQRLIDSHSCATNHDSHMCIKIRRQHTYIHINIFIYINTYTKTYIHICIYTYTYPNISHWRRCTHTPTQMYTHTYIHVRSHIARDTRDPRHQDKPLAVNPVGDINRCNLYIHIYT